MRILTVKLQSLGDIITFTPSLKALKDKYPNCKIEHIVNESCQIILKNDPLIDKVIITKDLGNKNKIIDFYEMIKLFLRIGFRKYDKVYIFHRNKLFVKFFRFCNINDIYIWNIEKESDEGKIHYRKFDLTEHRIYRHLRLIDRENYKKYDVHLRNFLDRSSKYEIPFKEYFVISPGGGRNKWSEMSSRRWAKENYTKYINSLENKKIILIGGQDDKEECEYIYENIDKTKNEIMNLAGKLSIIDTAKVIKDSKKFIGNDSMPLFLAGAYDIPLIGLFFSTDGSVINPIGEKFEYKQAQVKCSPCYSPLTGTGKGIAYECKKLECIKENLELWDDLNENQNELS